MSGLSDTEKKKAHVAHLISIGKTQGEAADTVGVSRETVSRWKKTDPNFQMLISRDEVNARLKLMRETGMTTNLKKISPADYHAIIYKMYGAAQDAIDFLGSVVRDPDAPMKERVASAQTLVNKVVPDAVAGQQHQHQVFHSQVSSKEVLGEAINLLAADNEGVIDDGQS